MVRLVAIDSNADWPIIRNIIHVNKLLFIIIIIVPDAAFTVEQMVS